MLNDASGFKKVYLATGFTDLRREIDGMAAIVRFQFQLDPYDKNTLFLFCGRRSDRIKALLWEGDGFSCIKGLKMVHSAGQDLRMRLWRSHRSSTGC